MSAKPHEIADFFRQLELLTRAGLPLPDSLRQLSGEYHHGGIRKVCADLADATSHGKTLSAAMQDHAETFSPFFIRMVEIGEKDGALPEAMGEIAKVSRRHYMMAAMLREILLYPFITITVGVGILIGICCFVLPTFRRILCELLDGHPLPGLTQFVMSFSELMADNGLAVLLVFLIFIGVGIWLFIASRASNRIMIRLARYLPYADIFFYNLSMARFCSLWAELIRHKIPVPEAFALLAATADHPRLAAAIKHAGERSEAGEAPLKVLEEEADISRLLVMTLKNTPEEARQEQLEKLAEMFYERGDYGFHRVGLAWELISLIGMVLVVGGIILILFLPYFASLFL